MMYFIVDTSYLYFYFVTTLFKYTQKPEYMHEPASLSQACASDSTGREDVRLDKITSIKILWESFGKRVPSSSRPPAGISH
jgi:hypothetical protein